MPEKPLVVFDIGNVLLAFSRRRAARNFDRVEPGSGAKLIGDLWDAPLGRAFERGRISGPELFRRLKKKHRLKMGYPRFRRAFNDIFTPMRPNLRLLEALSRQYPTALLSNTNAVHWAHILKKYPTLRRARWPYSSHLAGAMKPSAAVFRALSRRAGFSLDDMVFVDDIHAHVAAARRLGVAAVHYTGPAARRKLLKAVGGA